MRENPDGVTDPFSHLLALARARSVLSGGLVAGGDWAVAFPATEQVKFWGIRRGAAVLDAATPTPVQLRAGDVLLFRAPGPHVLAGTPGAQPVPLDTLAGGRRGAVLHHGGGDGFYMIGGKVELDAGYAPLLFGGLPPLVHIAGDSAAAQPIHWILDRLVAERDAALPGMEAASAQLAQLMLIEILRAHIAGAGTLTSGHLKASADRRLAPALRLLHGAPGRAWRLPELAAACAMSRAGFAAYFKSVAGTSPLRYLAELRMRLAQGRLRDGASIARLAEEFGYASESAFSHAFKRILGTPPSAVRQG